MLLRPTSFNLLKMSMNTNAKSASKIALSITNFFMLPYEILSNHIEMGIYGPILQGSSSLKNEFRLS
jgi:hypothetical protein